MPCRVEPASMRIENECKMTAACVCAYLLEAWGVPKVRLAMPKARQDEPIMFLTYRSF